MAQTTYVGSTDQETYSSVVERFSGAYYVHMRDSVIHCLGDILDLRVKEGCQLLTMADFGTADGANFCPLLDEVVRTIELKLHHFQTMMFFEDRIENDFNILFSKLALFQSKTFKNRNVFFSAIGRSMYNRCLPDQSLDIAVSSCALHWLSDRPCFIENGLSFYECNESEGRKFREQARKDWNSFLLCRGRELKSGGAIIALLPSDDGGFVLDVYKGLNEAWRRMLSLGKITKEEFRSTAILGYGGRTQEDFILPFEDPDIRDLGLRLVSINKKLLHLGPLLELKNSNDKSKYTRAAVAYVQAWTRNSIYHGLSDERTADEKGRIVDDFFELVYDAFFEADTDVTLLVLTEVVVKKDV